LEVDKYFGVSRIQKGDRAPVPLDSALLYISEISQKVK
jgi:hypothetical protein